MIAHIRTALLLVVTLLSLAAYQYADMMVSEAKVAEMADGKGVARLTHAGLADKHSPQVLTFAG